MSDLREKINGLVMVAADCFASPSQGDIERCGKVTDRILALLPKMPELRWDEHRTLMLGDIEEGIDVGEVAENADGTWRGGTSTHWVVWSAATEPEARAAVEAAVRKALGWEA